ncbi:MAG: sulfate reduction electron transfer complex DsrMKJOP subunit DsrJ [Planctomycetota bacterium]|jgi:hypothetical protein
MSDKTIIIAGLAVFVVAAAFPLWYTTAAGGSTPRPELELPVGESRCVMDKTYMAANHMQLLNEWRNAVVRRGERFTTGASGEKYEMSLVNTCMKCHTNKATFCDRCHDYADVAPDCWDCHVEPKGK